MRKADLASPAYFSLMTIHDQGYPLLLIEHRTVLIEHRSKPWSDL